MVGTELGAGLDFSLKQQQGGAEIIIPFSSLIGFRFTACLPGLAVPAAIAAA